MSHTKGPWEVVDCDFGDLEIHGGKTKSLVACPNIHNPYNEGNARLIAAAPEMLEAAKLVLESAYRSDAHDGDVVVSLVQLSKLEDAIRKARGE